MPATTVCGFARAALVLVAALMAGSAAAAAETAPLLERVKALAGRWEGVSYWSAIVSRMRVHRPALFLALAALAGAAGAQVDVTYLANEGFLIAAGERKVLVDALFPGIDGYPELSGSLKADLEAGRPPFDGVDLVLATHFHDDHFGPAEVARFLDATPAVFVSTRQAVDRLRGVIGDLPLDAIAPGPGGPARVATAGIVVETLDLHHGRYRDPPVENLGFLIEIDGITILHIGDTEASLEEFLALDLVEREIDLALLPVWYLTEPSWVPVVKEAMRPAAIVAMHLAEPTAPASWFGSAGGHAKRVRLIEAAWPDAWIPLEPLECRAFGTGRPVSGSACARPVR